MINKRSQHFCVDVCVYRTISTLLGGQWLHFVLWFLHLSIIWIGFVLSGLGFCSFIPSSIVWSLASTKYNFFFYIYFYFDCVVYKTFWIQLSADHCNGFFQKKKKKWNCFSVHVSVNITTSRKLFLETACGIIHRYIVN